MVNVTIYMHTWILCYRKLFLFHHYLVNPGETPSEFAPLYLNSPVILYILSSRHSDPTLQAKHESPRDASIPERYTVIQ